MSADRREIVVRPYPDAIARREFLRTLLVTGLGLPLAGSALLGGCGGGDASPGDALQTEVVNTRAALTQVVDAIRMVGDPANANIDGWLGQINARLGTVWPLMVAAGQAELRAAVSAEMGTVLTGLDSRDEELGFTGAAPTLTRARLQSAWDRASTMTALGGAQVRPQGIMGESLWTFLFMFFLVCPELSDSDAMTCAGDGAFLDTGGLSLELYGMLHPLGPVGCTPCLFSGLISRIAGLCVYVYRAMGLRAAHEPGLLFGRDWLTMFVLMSALLYLDFS